MGSSTKTYWYAAIGAVLGIAFTLVSGLIAVTPAGLVGAVWYGYPEAWLYSMVVAPQYNPWSVDYGHLAGDLVLWIVVFAVILAILGLMTERREARTKPSA